MRLPVMDGVELLKRTKAIDQEIEVIINTGFGTVEVAVVSQRGASSGGD